MLKKIYDNSWSIHDNSCLKNILEHSCLFMFIRVQKILMYIPV